MNILSVNYILHIALFVSVYWALSKKITWQNIILLVFNVFFYACWDLRALFLLLFLSCYSYFTGLLMNNGSHTRRKALMLINVIANFTVLFVFKYYNFFVSEFCNLFSIQSSSILFNLILPIGISFYTFTTTAYVIDVYKEKSKAEKNLITYLAFITFFPLIISGPIERSNTLLPQFKNKRTFSVDSIFDGIQQIAWGIFKKMVIADNCAVVVNLAFGNYEVLPASSLWIGAILYSIQIYFDFSGYSDLAIGVSKLFGLCVERNFHYPYFAINISDFWRRWHMSLQRWFTDYIYFPLGGSRCSKKRTILNTFVVFTICGIWHGANWTFIIWGVYNALLFVPYILYFKTRTKKSIDDNTRLPSFREVFQMGVTFFMVTFGWIMFNSPTFADAIRYIFNMFESSIITAPTGIGLGDFNIVGYLVILALLLEWFNKDKDYAMMFKAPSWVKVACIYVILAMLVFLKAGASDFIYLQF